MAFSDDIENEGAIDTGDDTNANAGDNSGAAPVTAQAPEDDSGAAPVAGAQPQQPQQPQQPAQPGSRSGLDFNAAHVPGNAKRIISYLMGADASPPTALDQAGQEIDPQGQLTVSQRNLLAIDAAATKGGPEAAWPLVQANRVAYNAKTAFAKTALTGIQGKPADLNAAVDAANQAQSHVLDGSDVNFAAAQGGVTATVTAPGNPQPQRINLTPQQFAQFLDVGGDGQWDKIVDHTALATLQRLAQSQPQQQTPQGPAAQQQQRPSGQASAANRQLANVNRPAPGAPAPQQTGAAPQTPQEPDGEPDSEAVRTGQPIARDVTEGDQPPTPGSHDAHGRYLGPAAPDETNYGAELEARARRMFPSVNQHAERDAWMAAQEEKELERNNKIAVASQQGINAVNTMRARNEGIEAVATTKAGAWQYASQQKYEAAKLQVAEKLKHLEATNANAAQTRGLKLAQTYILQMQPVPPELQKYLDQLPGAAQEGAQVTKPGNEQRPQQPATPGSGAGKKMYNGKLYTREQYEREVLGK